jgi:hypothetical protein
VEYELKKHSGTGFELKNAIIAHMLIYFPHHFNYSWLNAVKKHDRYSLGASKNGIYAQSDFSAQPSLIPQDGGNCARHGVCVLDCFVVLYSPRDVTCMIGKI